MPASVIFAGVGVLLTVSILLGPCRVFMTSSYQAVKDVSASKDSVIELFERIETFFARLETYTEVPATHAMMDLIIKIMVEVLGILAIATEEIKQRPASELIP